MKSRMLSTGVEIPYLGFGTYLIPDDAAPTAVGEALRVGYRHIDTAEAYHSERGVGVAIKRALDDGDLTRADLFVTTKLWPGNAAWGQPVKDRQSTVAALEASLERLGLDYVDLYLVHAPFRADDRLAQWQGMVDAQQQGLTRTIGVSNFGVQHLEELKTAGLPTPAANQLELHPWSQKPDLVRYLAENHIAPIAYSSLIPLATWRASDVGQSAAKTAQMTAEGEQDDAPFKVMARKYGVTEAQVLLRWAVQKGYPVLPKSTNPDRIRTNADIFGFTIDDDDLAAIETMDRGDGVAWGSGDPTRNA